MPLTLTTEVTVVPAVTATAFEVQGFSVNNAAGILDITYSFGSMSTDTPPVFIPSGQPLNLHLGGVDFIAFIKSNPTLYSEIKSALYTALQAAHNATGTVV